MAQDGNNYEFIGSHFGISGERIRQIVKDESSRPTSAFRLLLISKGVNDRAINTILNYDCSTIEDIRDKGRDFWFRCVNLGKTSINSIEAAIGGWNRRYTTGPLKPDGEEWTGYFFRGDEALGTANTLRMIAKSNPEMTGGNFLIKLASELETCREKC